MIADKKAMLAIAMDDIRLGESIPFPIYLHLELNKRFVPVVLFQELAEKKIIYLKSKSYNQFYVPESYKDVLEDYLRNTNEPEEIFEETEIVSEVLQDEELSQEAKAEILASLGQDLLRSFNQIANRDGKAQAEGMKRGKQITDEILAIASQNSNIYEEILALRNSKEDIEHSIIVSTLSVMFGLALGYTSEVLLADIASAGLFHDIGLIKIDPEILGTPERELTPEMREEYDSHVFHSVEILKEAKGDFPPRLYTIVEQHHENYDGSGFPNGLAGPDILEYSQVLHLANWFDRLSAGKIDGILLSPGEAFDRIQESAVNENEDTRVQPELLQRIFQFMLEEQEAAERLMMEAEDRAKEIQKSTLSDEELEKQENAEEKKAS